MKCPACASSGSAGLLCCQSQKFDRKIGFAAKVHVRYFMPGTSSLDAVGDFEEDTCAPHACNSLEQPGMQDEEAMCHRHSQLDPQEVFSVWDAIRSAASLALEVRLHSFSRFSTANWIRKLEVRDLFQHHLCVGAIESCCKNGAPEDAPKIETRPLQERKRNKESSGTCFDVSFAKGSFSEGTQHPCHVVAPRSHAGTACPSFCDSSNGIRGSSWCLRGPTSACFDDDTMCHRFPHGPCSDKAASDAKQPNFGGGVWQQMADMGLVGHWAQEETFDAVNLCFVEDWLQPDAFQLEKLRTFDFSVEEVLRGISLQAECNQAHTEHAVDSNTRESIFGSSILRKPSHVPESSFDWLQAHGESLSHARQKESAEGAVGGVRKACWFDVVGLSHCWNRLSDFEQSVHTQNEELKVESLGQTSRQDLIACLDTECGLEGLAKLPFPFSMSEIPRDLPDIPGLMPEIDLALRLTPKWDGVSALDTFMYVDGSFQKPAPNTEKIACAWSVVVIGRLVEATREHPFCFVGYISGIVPRDQYENPSAYVAELYSHLQAARLALTAPLGSRISLEYDNTSAAAVALGRSAASTEFKLTKTVRGVVCIVQDSYVVCGNHVYSHEKQPWNELADLLAKLARNEVHVWPQHLESLQQCVVERVGWLATVQNIAVKERCDYPPFWQGVLDITKDRSSPEGVWKNRHAAECSYDLASCSQALICLNLCTYNAMTMRRPGKADLCQFQFERCEFDVVGLQETRLLEPTQHKNGTYIRLGNSCNAAGNDGCAIWLRREAKVVFENRRWHTWSDESIVVLHSSPRCFAITVAAGSVQFGFICAHAHTSCSEDAQIEQWWQHDLRKVVTKMPKHAHVVILCDANARYSEEDGSEAVSEPIELNAECMQTFAEKHNLFVAKPDMPTWYSNRASGAAAKLDYMMLPASWQIGAGQARVLQDFENMSTVVDHQPVWMRAEVWVPLAPCERMQKSKLRINRQALQTEAGKKICQQILETAPRVGWHVHASQHCAMLEEHFSACLKTYFPVTPKRRRKAYVSGAALAMISQKQAIKRQLRCMPEVLRKQCLWVVFSCWKHQSCPQQTAPETWTWRQQLFYPQCAVAFLSRQIRCLNADLKRQLKHDKAGFTQQTVSQARDQGPAALLRALRPLTGNRKCGQNFALPALRREDGNFATTPSEVLDTLEAHFSKVERGVSMLKQDFEEEFLRRQTQLCKAWSNDDWNLDANLIPTKLDLEQIVLLSQNNKAPGLNGIPTEFYKACSCKAVDVLHPLVLKTFLRGEEPIQWHGALCKALPKSTQLADDPEKWRQIQLFDPIAKASHKYLRNKLMERLPNVVAPHQYGAQKQRSPAFPAHIARLHQQVAPQQHQSHAILFVDAKQAYHRVVRDMIWSDAIAPNDIEKLLGACANSTREKAALRRAFDQTSPFDLAQVPWQIQNTVRSVMLMPWLSTQPDGTRVATSVSGTRPGDPLADALFGYAFSCFLNAIRGDMVKAGIQATVSWDGKRSIEEADSHTMPEAVELDAPTWADDVAILLQADDPAHLVSALKQAAGIVHSRLSELGLNMNLQPGKSAGLVNLQGPGSRALKTAILHEHGSWLHFDVGDEKTEKLQLVSTYRHLGGEVVESATLMPELRRRFHMAKSVLKPLLKPLFENRLIIWAQSAMFLSGSFRAKFCSMRQLGVSKLNKKSACFKH